MEYCIEKEKTGGLFGEGRRRMSLRKDRLGDREISSAVPGFVLSEK